MTLAEFTDNCYRNNTSVKIMERNAGYLLLSVTQEGCSPEYDIWKGASVLLHTDDYLYALQKFRNLVQEGV